MKAETLCAVLEWHQSRVKRYNLSFDLGSVHLTWLMGTLGNRRTAAAKLGVKAEVLMVFFVVVFRFSSDLYMLRLSHK